MTTLTVPSIARRAAPRPVAAPAAAPRRGWIVRLANWADRQPRHRRLGSWTMA